MHEGYYLLVKFICLLFIIPLVLNAQDWVFDSEVEGIKVYKRDAQDEIIPIRVEANIFIDAKTILGTILDVSNRPKWVPLLTSSRYLEKKSATEFKVEEIFDAPWPISDRRLILDVKVLNNNPYYIIRGHGILIPDEPDSNIVNAEVKEFEIKLHSKGKYLSSFSFNVLVDPKGHLPFWIINYVQEIWPIRFVQWLRHRLDYPNEYK